MWLAAPRREPAAAAGPRNPQPAGGLVVLDPDNGDPIDVRLDIPRILCPTCHALTDTWCMDRAGVLQRQRGRV